MITEKGSVKTSVKIDGKVQGELNKTTRVLGIVYIVAGAVIAALGLLGCFAEAFHETDDYLGTLFLTLGLILLLCGIVLQFVCKNLKNAVTKYARVEDTEFFGDYLIERVYTDGEHTSTNKVYYKWLVKIKETKNYLFLYNSRATAIAVDKNSLPPNELNTIRVLLGRAPQSAPAAVQNEPKTDTLAAVDVPPADKNGEPADPFADVTENRDNKDN